MGGNDVGSQQQNRLPSTLYRDTCRAYFDDFLRHWTWRKDALTMSLKSSSTTS